jgi:hypothetical protein
MPLNSVPKKLLAKAVLKFLDGVDSKDRAPGQALSTFVIGIAHEKRTAYAAADALLDDPQQVAALKEEARKEKPTLESVLAKAAIKFLDGVERGDHAPERAHTKFVTELLGNNRPDAYDVADIVLDTSYRIEKLKENAKKEIADEEIADKQKHKSAHEARLEKFHKEIRLGNKISLWVGIALSLASLAIGSLTGSLAQIVFKHQLRDLDKKWHPEDYKEETNQKVSPTKPTTLKQEDPPAKTAVQQTETKAPATKEQSCNPVLLEIGPKGLWNADTKESMLDLLKRGKAVLLPGSKFPIRLQKSAIVPCKQASVLQP